MEIKSVKSSDFKKYGKVVDIDATEILDLAKAYDMPEGVDYFASIEAFEATSAAKVLEKSCFGGMPIEVGMCLGHNTKLNAVEYHRNSEINIAAYDMILLLGEQKDIEDDFTYDTSKIEAFLVPAGVAVEIYGTTLHYAPCSASEGAPFISIVVLPKGTNFDLTEQPTATPEDKLMTAVNKWLIAHEEAAIDGAFNGLKGENIDVLHRS